MLTECVVIIIILGITAYMFIRSKRSAWAPVVLPLMLIPFVNILYHPIGTHIAKLSLNRANVIKVIIYIIAFLISSVWIVFVARRLPSGKSKYAYIISSVMFTAVLVLIFSFKVMFK